MKNQNENSSSPYGLLRVGEVCEALGLGRTKVCELIANSAIPSVKIGASRRIRESALRAYIDGLETPSVSQS
jgi:excisionase family DNA binding protein